MSFNFSLFRTNFTVVLILITSYLFYTLSRIHKSSKEKNQLLKMMTNQVKKENVDAKPARPLFNNQPFNPEVCNTKSFLIVSALFCCVAIMGVIIGLFVQTAFPIFIFVFRFFLSVVCPLIVYANNSNLRTFVKEMFLY